MKNLILVCVFFISSNLSAQIIEYETFEAFEQNVLNKTHDDQSYIINFWATWCKPCVKELPLFEKLNNSDLDGIKVILVSLDFKKQIESKLYPFLDKNKLKTEVLVLTDGDYNSWIDRIDPSWSGAIPATLFIKGDKRFFVEKEYHTVEEIYKDLNSIN